MEPGSINMGIRSRAAPSLSVKAVAGCGEGRSLQRGRKGKRRPALSLEGGEVTTEGIEQPRRQADGPALQAARESYPAGGKESDQRQPALAPSEVVGHFRERSLKRMGSLSGWGEKRSSLSRQFI